MAKKWIQGAIHHRFRGQCSVAILILLRTANPRPATLQPHPRQTCRRRWNQRHGLQKWANIRSTSSSDRSGRPAAVHWITASAYETARRTRPSALGGGTASAAGSRLGHGG